MRRGAHHVPQLGHQPRPHRRAGFDPAAHLHCGHDTSIAGAQATAAPTTRETRTPEQLAAAWARSPELLTGRRRLFDSTDRIDIGFDHQARTVAVLTFHADDRLGRHLDAVVACQRMPAGPSPAAT